MVTKERLAEIQERCDKATMGPWIVGQGDEHSFHQGKNALVSEGNRLIVHRAIYGDETFDKQTYADNEFIAAARQDLPTCWRMCGNWK